MRGRFALVLLVTCLGASALIVEARTHESFSASSYYDSNETVTTLDPVEPETNTTSGPLDRYPNGYQGSSHVWSKDTQKYETVNETVADPQDRYPTGYTGSEHVWNATTQKYESVGDVSTTDPTDRFPHGYYGKSKFDYKEGDTLTVVKSNGTVEESNSSNTDPLNRFPNGYYGKAKFGYKEGDTLTVVKSNGTVEKFNASDTDPLNRFPNGYYGNSKYDFKEGDTLTVVKSNGTVEESNSSDTDPLNRFPNGYYGNVKYDYKEGDTLTVVKSNGTVEESNSSDTDPLNRFPNGYYGNAKYDYKEGDTLTVVKSNGTVEESNSSDTDPLNRFPNGYYGNAKYDYKEGDTLTVVKSNGTVEKSNSSDTDPLNRFPNGYNGNAKYDYKEGDTLTVVKSNGTVEKSSSTETDPLNRYPSGYPGSNYVWNAATQKYDAVSNVVSTDPADRYTTGYYGKAKFDYKEGDTLTVIKSEGTYSEETSSYTSYTSVSKPDTGTFDPLNRYPQGYYGKASQTTKVAADSERYANGYFPSSDNGKTQIKPVSYDSYSGTFQTLPYPSSGIPFVPNGAGCTTAYWADHFSAWPAFLPVTSTVGDAFGEQAVAVYGQTTILEALLNYKSDAYSELLRAACTALVNSYTQGEFKISHIKVIEEFTAALVSKEAAAVQVVIFDTENVSSISAGETCT